ncbi:hypothetical protein L596_022286 [Steinernema carpocapsae]|uniref:RING-type domain-containing protein n=1 Tax=Steinernema carpocapsae TaxID=34508 RepID=A0A4U5MLB4_STECR|nr:hypothetical protein L596_022286 [Steinernema carpocapsae]
MCDQILGQAGFCSPEIGSYVSFLKPFLTVFVKQKNAASSSSSAPTPSNAEMNPPDESNELFDTMVANITADIAIATENRNASENNANEVAEAAEVASVPAPATRRARATVPRTQRGQAAARTVSNGRRNRRQARRAQNEANAETTNRGQARRVHEDTPRPPTPEMRSDDDLARARRQREREREREENWEYGRLIYEDRLRGISRSAAPAPASDADDESDNLRAASPAERSTTSEESTDSSSSEASSMSENSLDYVDVDDTGDQDPDREFYEQLLRARADVAAADARQEPARPEDLWLITDQMNPSPEPFPNARPNPPSRTIDYDLNDAFRCQNCRKHFDSVKLLKCCGNSICADCEAKFFEAPPQNRRRRVGTLKQIDCPVCLKRIPKQQKLVTNVFMESIMEELYKHGEAECGSCMIIRNKQNLNKCLTCNNDNLYCGMCSVRSHWGHNVQSALTEIEAPAGPPSRIEAPGSSIEATMD